MAIKNKLIGLGVTTLITGSIVAAIAIPIAVNSNSKIEGRVNNKYFVDRTISNYANDQLAHEENPDFNPVIVSENDNSFDSKTWVYSGAAWPDSIAGQKFCIGFGNYATNAILNDGNLASSKVFVGKLDIPSATIQIQYVEEKPSSNAGAKAARDLVADDVTNGQRPFVGAVFMSSAADNNWVQSNGFNDIKVGTTCKLIMKDTGVAPTKDELINHFGNREKWSYNFENRLEHPDDIANDFLETINDVKNDSTKDDTKYDLIANQALVGKYFVDNGYATVADLPAAIDASKSLDNTASNDVISALKELKSIASLMSGTSFQRDESSNIAELESLKYDIDDIRTQLKDLAFLGVNKIIVPSIDKTGKTLFNPNGFNEWINKNKLGEIGNKTTLLTQVDVSQMDLGEYDDVLSAYLNEAAKLGIKVGVKTMGAEVVQGNYSTEGTLVRQRPDWTSKNGLIGGEDLSTRPDGVRVRGLDLQNKQVQSYISYYSQWLSLKLPNVDSVVLSDIGTMYPNEAWGLKGQFGFNEITAREMLAESEEFQKCKDFNIYYLPRTERENIISTMPDKELLGKFMNAVIKNGMGKEFNRLKELHFTRFVDEVSSAVKSAGGNVTLVMDKYEPEKNNPANTSEITGYTNGRGLDFLEVGKAAGHNIDELIYNTSSNNESQFTIAHSIFGDSRIIPKVSITGRESDFSIMMSQDIYGGVVFNPETLNNFSKTIVKTIFTQGDLGAFEDGKMKYGSLAKLPGGN